jgi:hypothetical protein
MRCKLTNTSVLCRTVRSFQARTKLSQRPWRVDDFDEFAEVSIELSSASRFIALTPVVCSALQVWFSKSDLDSDGHGKWWHCVLKLFRLLINN